MSYVVMNGNECQYTAAFYTQDRCIYCYELILALTTQMYNVGRRSHTKLLGNLWAICNSVIRMQVNSGMIKMYQVEVLSKLPIMQHFLFGSLFPFADEPA